MVGILLCVPVFDVLEGGGLLKMVSLQIFLSITRVALCGVGFWDKCSFGVTRLE